MALINRPPQTRPEIDLSGPQGNAIVIIGTASKLGKQVGMSQEEVNEMVEDMMSSNYEHVIRVFDRHFGQFVDLILPEGMTIGQTALDEPCLDDTEIVSSITFEDEQPAKFKI